ncbi:hypothetical protein GCM10010390_26600 [Streptomyces mordarskii]|uniref:SnoaL-like domain-containing protein n=2 Tax=Streptomyces TaxID=1883 RepID=A0ABN1CP21_9ACTN
MAMLQPLTMGPWQWPREKVPDGRLPSTAPMGMAQVPSRHMATASSSRSAAGLSGICTLKPQGPLERGAWHPPFLRVRRTADHEFGWLLWIPRVGGGCVCMGDGHAPGLSGREDVLGADWESHRPAVFGVAYRLLGSVADAEDVTPGLVRLLHPDAVYVTDGGGKAAAARKLIHGGQRVAEVMVRVGRQWRPDRIDLAEVGGELALVFRREGRVRSVDTLQITDGLITAYRRVVNPDKLSHV